MSKETLDTSEFFNPSDGGLPFAYFNPDTEGKVYWICNYDHEQNITSVFCFDDGVNKEKKTDFLPDFESAVAYRDELISNNWRKMKPPKVEMTYPDKDGKKQKLNRKQKRYLKRKLQKLKKEDPFIDDDVPTYNETVNPPVENDVEETKEG